MAIELEKAPECCKKSMESIYDKLETGEVLEEFLAAAPSIVKPRISLSKTPKGILSLLWDLGTRVWSWRKNRPASENLIIPIIQNRIKLIIDQELVTHIKNNENELATQWKQIRWELIN